MEMRPLDPTMRSATGTEGVRNQRRCRGAAQEDGDESKCGDADQLPRGPSLVLHTLYK